MSHPDATTLASGTAGGVSRGALLSERGYFRGYGLQPVDDKGRVAIPAALRAILEQNTPPRADGKEQRQVILSTHEDERCLIAYDLETERALVEDLRQRDAVGPGGRRDYNLMRRGAGAAETLPFDASGRFILPAFPRFHAAIEGFAFFYGAVDYFEIWDPATLLQHQSAPEVMKAACRFLMTQRGLAA